MEYSFLSFSDEEKEEEKLIVSFNTEELERVGLTPFQFILLWSIHYDSFDCGSCPLDEVFGLKDLTRQKYLLVHGDKLSITRKATDLFKNLEKVGTKTSEKEEVINLDELAEEIRNIFPKGIKAGGRDGIYPVRSPHREIVEKLVRFFKRYESEKYTHLEIIAASRLYVKEYEAKNWVFMSTSKHFIIKKKNDLEEEVSILAQYIERVRSIEEEYKRENLMEAGNTKLG